MVLAFLPPGGRSLMFSARSVLDGILLVLAVKTVHPVCDGFVEVLGFGLLGLAPTRSILCEMH